MTSIEPCRVVLVRYKDHVFYKDTDASKQTPRILEAIGRLDYENNEFIRVTWEEYQDPNSVVPDKVLSTGLVILKSTIVEICQDSRPHSTSAKRLA